MLMLMVTVTDSIMERVCASICVYIYLLLLCECPLTTAIKDEIFGIQFRYPSYSDKHYKGKVQIQINHKLEWYDICYDGSNDADHQSWNRAAATVACRQLGFQAGWNGSRHGIGSTYTFEGFVCTNYSARSLNDCTYEKELRGCDVGGLFDLNYDQDQAFVECYNLTDTMIRLQPLDTTSERNHSGQLEAMYRGEWYGVCYHGTSSSDRYDWNIRNANVACNQLGYSLGAVQTSMLTSDPYMRRHLSFDDFRCNGDEDNLFSCFPDPPNESECGEGNHVFIVCKEPESTTFSTTSDMDHASTQEHVIGTEPELTTLSTTSDMDYESTREHVIETESSGPTLQDGFVEGVLNSQVTDPGVIIGSVIGVVVVLVIVIAAILCIVQYLRKINKIPPKNTENSTLHSNGAFQNVDNGYADIQNGGPQDNTYAYADVTMGNPEPTQSVADKENRRDVGDNDNVEGWADNIAYVSYGNENVQHSETRDGDGWTENKIYGD